MADFQINPNIPLMAQQSDPLGDIQSGLQLGQQIQQMPLQNELLRQKAQQNQQVLAANQAKAAQAEKARVITSVAQGYQEVKGLVDSGDFQGAVQVLGKRRARLVREGKSTVDTDEAIAALESDDATQIQRIKTLGDTAIEMAVSARLLEPGGGVSPDKTRSLDIREKELALKTRTEERQNRKFTAISEKALLDAQDNVVSSQRASNEFNILADQYEQLDIGGGLASSTTETFKKLLGTQDDVTEFRRRFNKVRLSEGLKNLPPGPATDRDVIEAFKGVPPENAPAAQVVSFLRGAARLSRLDAAYSQFKADFISDNTNTRGLNKAWRQELRAPAIDRVVSMAEIYETAQNKSITPEEVKQKLGIE